MATTEAPSTDMTYFGRLAREIEPELQEEDDGDYMKTKVWMKRVLTTLLGQILSSGMILMMMTLSRTILLSRLRKEATNLKSPPVLT